MAPKPIPQKAPVVRPSISSSSLLFCPDDVVEGFQERITTGIDWTNIAKANIHHMNICLNEDILPISFTEALDAKVKDSVLYDFMKEESSLSLEEQYNLLTLIMWDNEKCNNEEGQICFRHNNGITDNLESLIKGAIKSNDRQVIRNEFEDIQVLRLNGCKMTYLDEGLQKFKKLITLNLCCNCLTEIDGKLLPDQLKILELHGNAIRTIEGFVEELPSSILYLGLSNNILSNDSAKGLGKLPYHLTTIDVSDNDIYSLDMVLPALIRLPKLTSLILAGNPCSVCSTYARTTIATLHHLKYLDCRQIMASDRPEEAIETHPDDIKTSFFYFTAFRIMSIPIPPKVEKGTTQTFHVEFELPFLDSKRRNFLMFRRHESLIEMLPSPEDDHENEPRIGYSKTDSLSTDSYKSVNEAVSEETDVYANLIPQNPLQIINYTIFETNKVPWNKIVNFQEPAVRIFCPDLVALRNTFRTVITLRVVYTQTSTAKPTGKSTTKMKVTPAGEHRVVLATIRCNLQRLDWTQPSQHFFWDESLGTNEAIHWGDGDLSVLQYSQALPKSGKAGKEEASTKQTIPEIFTCHFGFGIETLRCGS